MLWVCFGGGGSSMLYMIRGNISVFNVTCTFFVTISCCQKTLDALIFES